MKQVIAQAIQLEAITKEVETLRVVNTNQLKDLAERAETIEGMRQRINTLIEERRKLQAQVDTAKAFLNGDIVSGDHRCYK
jgi:chromosome segregation ATPase